MDVPAVGEMPERGEGVTLWRQIEEAITADLEAGRFRPGERLPTELELSRRFGVNRHTVRRAIAALAQRGAIRVEQGRGTFVQEDIVDYTLGRRTRFSENILRQRREPSGQIVATQVIVANAGMATALRVEQGSPIAVIEILREADGIPISLGHHHFVLHRFPQIVEQVRAAGSVSPALAACGVTDYTRRVTRLTAQLPTIEEARLLRQPTNRPVLQAESVNVDQDGEPIEYGLTRFAGERVQIVVEP